MVAWAVDSRVLEQRQAVRGVELAFTASSPVHLLPAEPRGATFQALEMRDLEVSSARDIPGLHHFIAHASGPPLTEEVALIDVRCRLPWRCKLLITRNYSPREAKTKAMERCRYMTVMTV